MSMSGGLLGRWGACWRAARARGGRVDGNGACTVVHVGMVDSGAGTAFLAVLVSVFELGLVKRGR